MKKTYFIFVFTLACLPLIASNNHNVDPEMGYAFNPHAPVHCNAAQPTVSDNSSMMDPASFDGAALLRAARAADLPNSPTTSVDDLILSPSVRERLARIRAQNEHQPRQQAASGAGENDPPVPSSENASPASSSGAPFSCSLYEVNPWDWGRDDPFWGKCVGSFLEGLDSVVLKSAMHDWLEAQRSHRPVRPTYSEHAQLRASVVILAAAAMRDLAKVEAEEEGRVFGIGVLDAKESSTASPVWSALRRSVRIGTGEIRDKALATLYLEMQSK